jgi:alpha-glucosidase
MQNPALTTREARNSPWSLLTALDAHGSAQGDLYIDDGVSLVQNATLNVKFKAASSSLSAIPQGDWKEENALDKVTVFGVKKSPHSVTLNGKTVPSSSVHYNSTSQSLLVGDLQKITSEGAWSKKWILKW